MKEGYKRNRSEEFCHSILDASDGRKRIPFPWVFACISFPLPPFLVVSKSSSWSFPLLSFFIVFLSPSPDCDLVPSYCAMCWHTVHLCPRYGGAFPLAASSCGVTAERSQIKFVTNALMQLLNSVPYLLKLLSEPEAKNTLNFPLFFPFSFSFSRKCPIHREFTHNPLQTSLIRHERDAGMNVCLPSVYFMKSYLNCDGQTFEVLFLLHWMYRCI